MSVTIEFTVSYQMQQKQNHDSKKKYQNKQEILKIKSVKIQRRKLTSIISEIPGIAVKLPPTAFRV